MSGTALVFLTDDLKSAQVERGKGLTGLGCRVTQQWHKDVSHVVASSRWLQNKRNVELLYVQLYADRVVIVPFDWVHESLEAGRLLPVAPRFRLRDAAFEAAAPTARALLRHTVIYLFAAWREGRGTPFHSSAIASSSSSSSSSSSATAAAAAGRLIPWQLRDVALLAALHGADVRETFGGTSLLLADQDGLLYRGYSAADLAKMRHRYQAHPQDGDDGKERLMEIDGDEDVDDDNNNDDGGGGRGDGYGDDDDDDNKNNVPKTNRDEPTAVVVRVLVVGPAAVSKLGLEIFAANGIRPLLADWLAHALVNLRIPDTERFTVYG